VQTVGIRFRVDASQAAIERALDYLTRVDLDYLRAHPGTPPLSRAAVRYRREVPPREDWQSIPELLATRAGDCEDLASWRAAELLARGIPAKAVAKRTGVALWHIVVRYKAGGRVFENDPSRELGMGKKE